MMENTSRLGWVLVATTVAAALVGGCRNEPPPPPEQPPLVHSERVGDATAADQAATARRNSAAAGPDSIAGDETSDTKQSSADSLPTRPSDEQLEVFWSSPEDEATDFLDGVSAEASGRHYLSGDEWNLELFQPHLVRKGGGYMGVGTDQAYLFIGWTKPEFAWLTDYDPWVVAVHKLYAEFFARAEDIDEMARWWSPRRVEQVEQLIAEKWGEDEDAARLIRRAYGAARRKQYKRLTRMREEHRAQGIVSWASDEATYQWVRSLVLAGRVRPMLGNLLDSDGLRGVSQAAETLGVPIRAVYLSNAEEYWNYDTQFRENMLGLHTDEQTVLLRTIASTPDNNDYHYFVHPWANYERWLRESKIRHVYYVAKRRRIRAMDDIPFRVITEEPAEGLARMREHAKRN